MRDMAIAVVEWVWEYWVPLLFLLGVIALIGLLVVLEKRNPCREYSNKPPIYVQGQVMVPVRECLKREKE